MVLGVTLVKRTGSISELEGTVDQDTKFLNKKIILDLEIVAAYAVRKAMLATELGVHVDEVSFRDVAERRLKTQINIYTLNFWGKRMDVYTRFYEKTDPFRGRYIYDKKR